MDSRFLETINKVDNTGQNVLIKIDLLKDNKKKVSERGKYGF